MGKEEKEEKIGGGGVICLYDCPGVNPCSFGTSLQYLNLPLLSPRQFHFYFEHIKVTERYDIYWPAPPSIHRGLEWPQCLNRLFA